MFSLLINRWKVVFEVSLSQLSNCSKQLVNCMQQH